MKGKWIPMVGKTHLLLVEQTVLEIHWWKFDMDTPSKNYKLVVSTHLKNISQIGSFLQVGMNN